jgi:hypothetical protein
VAIVSYDEKPGIQAIANTATDLPPEPGVQATFARDHEYKRYGSRDGAHQSPDSPVWGGAGGGSRASPNYPQRGLSTIGCSGTLEHAVAVVALPSRGATRRRHHPWQAVLMHSSASVDCPFCQPFSGGTQARTQTAT